MSTSPDLVALLEHAYRLDVDDPAWLDGVVRASTPMLERGMGVFGFLYQTMNVTSWSLGQVVNVGAPPEVPEILREVAPQSPPEMTRRFFWSSPCITVLDLLGDGPGADFLRNVMAPYGAEDVLMIKAADPTGVALSLCAPLKKHVAVGRPTTALWSRLCAHLAAAHRLRRVLRSVPAGTDFSGAEAVLSPGGKCEHAVGAAQDRDALTTLRAAAVQMDRARGGLRRKDPDAALDLWRGLVAGRWSLLDQFDTDGRRYLVARRNDPRTPDPRALTERERQVAHFVAMGHTNKLIAYELGLSEGSVATHLRRGIEKLGVGGRVQLAERFHQLGGTAEAPGAKPLDSSS
jgi:DNA-binding CsgD family transcriptional regulator